MSELTSRFDEALSYAFRLHARQKRKVANVPYISHLLAVTALVLEDGGDEDLAIAALLHDAVEDQGGIPILDEIRVKFGTRVADIVDGCTDSYGKPKPPWRERKSLYLDKLSLADDDVRRVSLADKVHNARAIVASLQQHGAATWKWFNGGKTGTLWYYQELQREFTARGHGFLSDELARWVDLMIQLAEQKEIGK